MHRTCANGDLHKKTLLNKKKDEMMVVLWTWIFILLLSLATATGSSLIALRIHYRMLDKTRQEREAWQQAQEGRQRTWEVRQGKHILDTEKKQADQFNELRREWRDWKIEAKNRIEIEQELARLPHIEDVQIAIDARGARQQPDHWRPPVLYRAKLEGRDLSYRYMGRADLREADLHGANLYMADLTGACLTGANLERANLVGTNLSGADLREANLSGANFMVTDLHKAILHGATLLGARNLSAEQLRTALYDRTTSLDDVLTASQEPAISERPTLPAATNAGDLAQDEDEDTLRTPALKPGSTEASATLSDEVSDNEQSALTPDTPPTPAESSQPLNESPVEVDPEKETDDDQQLTEQEESAGQENPPSHKIIQLQAHTPKAVLLQNSKKRSTSKKHGERKTRNRSGGAYSKARGSGNQQAQAN
jgi:uncharacterized protein YjbI with pentapeptide repeats